MADINKIQYVDYNIVPEDAALIGVFQGNNKIGDISIPSKYKLSTVTSKLYSFGALSDVHIQYETGVLDLQHALTWLNSNADFVTICGDLTENGSDTLLQQYKELVDNYANIPVYAISGNHEGYASNVEERISTYTGQPLYYYIEKGNDVFIFVGLVTGNKGDYLFGPNEMQWLYETLESFRNRRCFVFQHVRPQDGCGNVFGIYNWDIWDGLTQEIFEALVNHYKNVYLFHGHSHLKLSLLNVAIGQDANVCQEFGLWCIHIPSLAVPRDGGTLNTDAGRRELYSESEGYLVDVYKNGIILKGRDFANNKYIPCAQYWLPWTKQIVHEETFISPNTRVIVPEQHRVNLNTVLFSETCTFTKPGDDLQHTAVGNFIQDEDRLLINIPSSFQGKKWYAKWDYFEYSRDSFVEDKVGIILTDDKGNAKNIDYLDYTNEVELICREGTTNAGKNFGECGIGQLQMLFRPSREATINFPVTMSIHGFRIYYKEDGEVELPQSLDLFTVPFTATGTLTAKGTNYKPEPFGNFVTDNTGLSVTIPSNLQGKRLYAKCDSIEYSGNNFATEKVGIIINNGDTNQVACMPDYADYTTEQELISRSGTSKAGINFGLAGITKIQVAIRASSSSTAKFPVTFTVNNLRIYAKE